MEAHETQKETKYREQEAAQTIEASFKYWNYHTEYKITMLMCLKKYKNIDNIKSASSQPWLVWIDRRPAKQMATSSVPSQGTCLGCGPGPQVGAYKRQTHIDVSLPLFLSPFPSL